MLTAIQKIEKKIIQERKILEHEAKEITVDWVAVQAEVRLKAFEEAVDVLYLSVLRCYGCAPRPLS